MMCKPVLMIHELHECFFDKPLHNYTLTFDDGLLSQYMFIDRLLQIETDKYFFISSNIVCDETTSQSYNVIPCVDAHEMARKGNMSNYMRWSQIKYISKQSRCFIGSHGHDHILNITDNIDLMIQDTQLMKNKFEEQDLSKALQNFCFPYNIESDLYKAILKTKINTREFFGKERTCIYEVN